MMLPLTGVKVVSVEKLLPAPFATRILADLGASVIRVSDPRFPDLVATFPPLINSGSSALYHALNRGKEELVGRFDDAAFQKQVLDAVASANVLVINMKPGAFDSVFGLSPKQLMERHPALIVCMITAYGSFASPLQALPGHDLNCCARSGMLSMTKTPQNPPIYMSDYMCAMNSCVQILAALMKQKETGNGSYLDVSMLGSAFAGMFLSVAAAMTDATLCERMIGGKHPLHGALPNYDVYPAKNGTFIAVGCLEPALWSRFAKLLQVKPDRQSVAAKLLEKTADEWESICAKAKLPVDKVRSPAEAVRDHPEMFAALGMTTNVTIDGKEYSLPVPPVRSPADTEEPLMKIRSRM